MSNGIDGLDGRFVVNRPLKTGNDRSEGIDQTGKKENKKISFDKILADKLKKKSGVKFSRHARKRLKSRGIKVSEKELGKLKSAVKKAEDKGACDSLIKIDDVSYVVSVENRTVITALDNENMKENVFTNIDSAVFM